MSQELYEKCREIKDTLNPRITNQDIAEASGKSERTVSQFLRGESPNASCETVAAICKELGVSIDEHYGIKEPSQFDELARKIRALESENASLRDESAILQAHISTCKKSIRMHRFVTAFLLIMLFFALSALVYDLMNPSVGWIRETASILTKRLFL